MCDNEWKYITVNNITILLVQRMYISQVRLHVSFLGKHTMADRTLGLSAVQCSVVPE